MAFLVPLGLSLLLASLTAAPCAAEVTLTETLRAAVTARPELQAARAEAEAAGAAADEARSGWLPHLTLHERFTRTDEPAGSLFLALNQERNVMANPGYDLVDPGEQDDFETRLQVTQTLYDPAVDYGLRRARKLQQAALAGATWSAEESAFGAFRAYLDVQTAQAALTEAQSSLREAEEISRLAGERYRAGLGLKADELRAGVQLAEARRRELAAGNDLLLSRRRLALAMGDAGGERQIAAVLDESIFPAVVPPDAAMTRADLAALALQTEAAGLAERESRAAWLPSLDMSAHYAWHDEDTPFTGASESWAIGAGLRWELFDGLRRDAATARTSATLRAREARLVEARREREFLLAEARLRAEEARLQRGSARQAVSAAEESQRLFRQRYEAGLLDLADLLAAQNALDRARFDAVAAEARRLLALGNIQFQAGRFLATFLPEKEQAQ